MEIITITPEREHFSTFFQWIGCVTITGFWRFRMHSYLYLSWYFKTWLILQCLHLQAILYISVTLLATSMQHYWLDAIVCFATGYICNFWFLLQALGVFCRLLFASDWQAVSFLLTGWYSKSASTCSCKVCSIAFQLRTSPLSCCLLDIFLLPAPSVLASFYGLVAAPHIFSIELFFHNASIFSFSRSKGLHWCDARRMKFKVVKRTPLASIICATKVSIPSPSFQTQICCHVLHFPDRPGFLPVKYSWY